MKDQILVSWIGHADLIAMSGKLSAKSRKTIEAIVDTSRDVKGDGPVKALVSAEKFKEIHLLNSYGASVAKLFSKWIGGKPKIHDVEIENPTDHARILEIVQPIVGSLKLKQKDELCFHLSPGTPAMAAIWILLAKSKFPATLFQTFRGNVSKANVPFDVTVEVVPQLLSQPDRFWQHLVDDGTEETPGFSNIIGNSPALKMAIGRAKRASIFDVTVLILGESGTGKEMFGNAIHQASHRREGPFVSINCAAISRELLESELFGHVKGAFTGAEANRVGAFEQANGGTLFLDEVGECDLAMQAKILRALQPPPGASPSERVFRKLPPLRQRKGDVKLLAKSLMDQINERFSTSDRPGYVPKSLPNETLKYLDSNQWPGNVRELYNALIQAAIMQDSAKLKPKDIELALGSMPSVASRKGATEVVLGDGFDIDEHLDEIHRTLLRRAMNQSGNVKKRAAELLGVKNYQTLDARLKRLKIE